MSHKKFSMKNNLLPHLSADNASLMHDEFVRNFWPIVGTANQSAILWLLDVYDDMEEAGMLKQNVKLHAKKCTEEIDRYHCRARMALGDRFAIWSDLTNNATHNIYPDCMRLYFSVKAKIDKELKQDESVASDIRAKIFTVNALLQIATAMYDTLVKKYQSQTIFNIHKNFDAARLSAVLHHWDIVTKSFSNVNGSVDLNSDKHCQMAIKVILNRFSDKEFINEAAGDAIRQNPAMHKHLTEEEYKDIVENGTKEKDTTEGEGKAEE